MDRKPTEERDAARSKPPHPRVDVARDGHLVLDNPGREVGEDDRPGGPGLPTNQGGGRDGGAAPKTQDGGPATRGSG